MLRIDSLLDRAVPDTTPTEHLPPSLAAELDHLAGRTTRWTDRDRDVHPPALRARARAAAGDAAGARQALDSCTTLGCDSPAQLAAAVWAASRVGRPAHVEALSAPVQALRGDFLVDDGVPIGPRALTIGLLAVAAGRLDEARERLEEAACVGDRRAPVWGAVARLELGRVLVAGQVAPGAAPSPLVAAITFFSAAGFHHLIGEAHALTAPASAGPVAAPFVGHLVPGDRWEVGFGVQPPVLVAPAKGLALLRHLVVRPGVAVATVELDRVLSGDSAGAARVRSARTDPTLEVEQLRALLLDERARARVTKLLRRTIRRLADVHPGLAEHLGASLTTGRACRYAAPPGLAWRT